MNKKHLNTRQKGSYAEKIAKFYLEREGYEVIGQNMHFGIGEIDILAIKGHTLHFIEVKSSSYSFEEAFQNMTYSKIRKVRATVSAFFYSMENLLMEYGPDNLLSIKVSRARMFSLDALFILIREGQIKVSFMANI